MLGLRRFVAFLCLSLVALLLGAVVVLFLAFEDTPRVDRAPQFRPDHIERAKQVLVQNDPRRLRPGQLKTVVITAEDLDLAALYVVNRALQGSSRITLGAGTAGVTLTVPLPVGAPRRYLNVDAQITAAGSTAQLQHLEIGRVPVPRWIAMPALRYAFAHLKATQDLQPALNNLVQVSLSPDRVRMSYVWDPEMIERLRKTAISPEDRERLHVYQEHLARTVRTVGRSVSLAALMQPLLQLARDRSVHADPVAENRAWILILTVYANGGTLDRLLPEARHWPRPSPRSVTLLGRDDTAKHFIVSAALSAHAGEPLADAIGVYKEVEDSRGGSGFSFDDIAPDRAGSRFGELAAESPASARHLQARLNGRIEESDLVPAIADLPSFMPEAEFKRRFGGVGSPEYERMMAEIERRVAALPFNR